MSLDFLLGRFLPTVINRKPSIYNGSWAPPTPGLWNKVERQRHKIKNTTSFPGVSYVKFVADTQHGFDVGRVLAVRLYLFPQIINHGRNDSTALH